MPHQLHPNVQRVARFLADKGLSAPVSELDESTRTAPEAAAAVGCSIDEIVKSLVFTAGNEIILVLVSGAHRASIDKLGRLTASPVRQATPDEVLEATGFPVGGVPPVAHLRPLTTFIDDHLMEQRILWAAAGTARSVFSITPHDLAALIPRGRVANVREP